MDEIHPEWLTEGRTTLITEDGTGPIHLPANNMPQHNVEAPVRPHSRIQVRYKFWVSEVLLLLSC